MPVAAVGVATVVAAPTMALTANISNFSELAQLADVANIVAKDKPMEIIDVTPKKDEDEDE